MHNRLLNGLLAGVVTLATLLSGWGVLRLIDGKSSVAVAVTFLVVGLGLFVLCYFYRDKWRDEDGS